MGSFYMAWGISGLVLIIVASALGRLLGRGLLGFLIDVRSGTARYSLTQFQLFLWTFLIISLISAVFWTRLLQGSKGGALDFTIPGELLAVLGISVGSAATSTAVKTHKDDPAVRNRKAAANAQAAAVAAAAGVTTVAPAPAAAAAGDPFFGQVFLVEEGSSVDQAVDVTKFQNFWFTIILAAAYVALVVNAIQSTKDISDFALPGFSQQFVTLLGISHAGYIAGKLPTRS